MPKFDLVPEKILVLEFKYASETAAQSSNDRTAVVNLYLLLIGGASTALSSSLDLSPRVLSFVFFALALVGFSFVFKLVRLRQAWHESTKAMNAIKDFYLSHYPDLGGALRWKSGSIPEAGKPWSITFNLTLMVVILDSASLFAAIYFALAAADVNSRGLYYVPEVLAAVLFCYFQERFYTFHMPCKCAQGCEKGETACKERIWFPLWGKKELSYADGFFTFLFDPFKRHVITSGGSLTASTPGTPSADAAPLKAAPKRSNRSTSAAKTAESGSAQRVL